MNNNLNTAKAPYYIKHDSPEVKDVVNFADRFWYGQNLIKKLEIAMQKSDNHLYADMTMIRIQSLEWVQCTIQALITHPSAASVGTLCLYFVFCLQQLYIIMRNHYDMFFDFLV